MGLEKNIPLIAIIMFIFYMTTGVVTLFVPIYLIDAGFSNFEIGLVIGTVSIVALASTFVLGIFNDRISPKKMIIAGLLLSCVFFLALPWAETFLVLMAIFIIYGFGTNLFTISNECLMYKSLGKKVKGLEIGGIKFSGSAGSAIGFLLGGLIITLFGFDNIFLLLVALTLLIIPVSMILKIPSLHISNLSSYWKDYKRRDVLFFSLVMFLLAFHFGAEKTSMPLYANFNLGLSVTAIGLLFFISQMGYASFSFTAGFLSDKLKNFKWLFIVGLIFSGLGNILYGFTTDFTGAVLTRILHELGDGFVLLFSAYIITSLFGKQRIGGDYGAFLTILMIATFVGAVVSGFLNDVIGYGGAMIFAGSLTLVGTLLMLTSKKTVKFLFDNT